MFSSLVVEDLVVILHMTIHRLLRSEAATEAAHDPFHRSWLGRAVLVLSLAAQQVPLLHPALAVLAVRTLTLVCSEVTQSGVSTLAVATLELELFPGVLLQTRQGFLLRRILGTTTLAASGRAFEGVIL